MAKVVPNSTAANAKIERTDVVLTVNDKPISDIMSLKQVLIDFEAGQKTKLEYLVKGKGKTVTKEITFTSPPEAKDAIDQLEPPEIR